MAQMATPWKHPTSGNYYLRRQIPEALRPAFGGKALYKVSLRTKNFAKAAQLFVEANATLEREFETARDRLINTGDPRPSQKDHRDRLIGGYFAGDALEGELDGAERLTLAFLEGDRLLYRMLHQKDADPQLYEPPSDKERWLSLATNAALFQAERAKEKRSAGGRPGKLWKKLAANPVFKEVKIFHAKRIIQQIVYQTGIAWSELPDGLIEAVIDYLDQAPLEHQLRARKPRHAVSRLQPELRLTGLYEKWVAKRDPSKKCAHEYLGAVNDFIDHIGDIPVADITEDDLLTFRDAVAALPRHMNQADRKLKFSDRIAKHEGSEQPKVSGATVKKRVGGIQALLSFARRNRWISKNVGAGLGIDDDLPKSGVSRRTFLKSELKRLFSCSLFTDPSTWRIKREGLSDSTMFWLFLLGYTSGARLEELGQAATSDVRSDGDVDFIDIDDYVSDARGSEKHVKTEESRRLIPLHAIVTAAGFYKYVEALRRAGHCEVFPDLKPNAHGNRTQAASQRANRLIDRYVSDDPRLVFHSFRHTFKQRGTTARIDERILDQLCGHTPTTVSRKYGAGQPLQVLYEELLNIDFTCIDWERIVAALKNYDWDAAVARLPRPA